MAIPRDEVLHVARLALTADEVERFQQQLRKNGGNHVFPVGALLPRAGAADVVAAPAGRSPASPATGGDSLECKNGGNHVSPVGPLLPRAVAAVVVAPPAGRSP